MDLSACVYGGEEEGSLWIAKCLTEKWSLHFND